MGGHSVDICHHEWPRKNTELIFSWLVQVSANQVSIVGLQSRIVCYSAGTKPYPAPVALFLQRISRYKVIVEITHAHNLPVLIGFGQRSMPSRCVVTPFMYHTAIPAVRGVPPEDVGLAIIVEIPDTHNRPVQIGVGEVRRPDSVTPFMYQTRFAPVHGVPPEDVGLAVIVEIPDAHNLPVLVGLRRKVCQYRCASSPSMYQTAFRPFTVFLQRMSGLPSLLKSPLPTICQSRLAWRDARRPGTCYSVHVPDDVPAG